MAPKTATATEWLQPAIASIVGTATTRASNTRRIPRSPIQPRRRNRRAFHTPRPRTPPALDRFFASGYNSALLPLPIDPATRQMDLSAVQPVLSFHEDAAKWNSPPYHASHGHGPQELPVSLRSSLDAKEQIRQAIDIVELVGGVVQLRRQGRNYVGLCPWHDDSRPSLQVNPERQSFKCWVCDIGGDVFSFIMKMEGVEFPEALAMLADRAGISLEKPSRADKPAASSDSPESPAAPDKRTLYQAMAWAERQYHDCLLTTPRPSRPRDTCKSADYAPRASNNFSLAFRPTARLDPAAGRGRAQRRRCWRPSACWPGPPAAAAFTTASRAGAFLHSRRPGPACGARRPGAAGAVRHQPGQVRQFARDAAVRQEPLALRAGHRPRGDPQEPHRDGRWKAIRIASSPISTASPTRWPCWARHWASPISASSSVLPTASCWCSTATRRASAGQGSAGIVRRPGGRSADIDLARRTRPVRLPAIAGRGAFSELLEKETVDALGHAFARTREASSGARHSRLQPGVGAVGGDRGQGAATGRRHHGASGCASRRFWSSWRRSASTSPKCGRHLTELRRRRGRQGVASGSKQRPAMSAFREARRSSPAKGKCWALCWATRKMWPRAVVACPGRAVREPGLPARFMKLAPVDRGADRARLRPADVGVRRPRDKEPPGRIGRAGAVESEPARRAAGIVG